MKKLLSLSFALLALGAQAQLYTPWTNVYLGTGPNTGTGDGARSAFAKINTNDNYLVGTGLNGTNYPLAKPLYALVEGDSTSQGIYFDNALTISGSTWTTWLANSTNLLGDNPFKVGWSTVHASGGRTLATMYSDMISDYSTFMVPLGVPSSRTNGMFVVLGGHNDIVLSGSSAATLINLASNMCRFAHTNGVFIGLCTIPYSRQATNQIQYELTRSVYNDWLRTNAIVNWGASGCDYLFDLDWFDRSQSKLLTDNDTYHPGLAGHKLWAQYMFWVLCHPPHTAIFQPGPDLFARNFQPSPIGAYNWPGAGTQSGGVTGYVEPKILADTNGLHNFEGTVFLDTAGNARFTNTLHVTGSITNPALAGAAAIGADANGKLIAVAGGGATGTNVYLFQAADQVISTQTAFTNSTSITTNLTAGTWKLDGVAFCSASTTGGSNCRWTFTPAVTFHIGETLTYGSSGVTFASTVFHWFDYPREGITDSIGHGTDQDFTMFSYHHFFVTTNTTTVTFQFAQLSSAGNTTLWKGSTVNITRIK